MKGLVFVTGGPAVTPVDRFRVLTNRSTGCLAARLAACFHREGWRVVFFRSVFATVPAPADVEVRGFSTNEELAAELQAAAQRGWRPFGLFHAAALTDFEVSRTLNGQGEQVVCGKLDSGQEGWCLELRPAPKLLPRLRQWFVDAHLIGWKFEVDGDRSRVVARGQEQMKTAATDACVLNGPAWGEGFGWLDAEGLLICNDATELVQGAVAWLKKRKGGI